MAIRQPFDDHSEKNIRKSKDLLSNLKINFIPLPLYYILEQINS